jgi:uncharacterized protein (DUF2235 family)
MGKRIVLCFDGTWANETGDVRGEKSVSNVVRLYQSIYGEEIGARVQSAAGPKTGVAQLKWYDSGVGTVEQTRLDQVLSGLTGEGLSKNVLQGYQALVARYDPGDQLYLFGFSRGAYTARSLSGFISSFGILTRDHAAAAEKAYEAYRMARGGEEKAEADLQEFLALPRQTDLEITVLGVWETVGALGIPGEFFTGFDKRFYQFHDTNLSAAVKNAFHAIAIDEHRKMYCPALWTKKASPDQHVEQVWFAGAHSDVGGGTRYDDGGELKPNPISDVSLQWMQEKARELGGLELDPSRIPAIGERWLKVTDSFAGFAKGNFARISKDEWRVAHALRRTRDERGEWQEDGRFLRFIGTTGLESVHPSVASARGSTEYETVLNGKATPSGLYAPRNRFPS